MIDAIDYRLDKSMPKLGWIAVADADGSELRVLHGEFVEIASEWLVEGVWDGRFKEGNFHKTDIFFGSGIRKDGDKIYFVTSTAKTDRILFCRDRDRFFASNSLLLLLSCTGASLDPNHDYVDEAISVTMDGLSKYKREFRVVHPSIQHFFQIYHENVVLEKGEVVFEPKIRNRPTFGSFDDYYQSLMNKLLKIRDNYQSSGRKRPMAAYSTISSGYDAAAVSCLVRKLGVGECFIGKPLDGLIFERRAEPGERIARKLGCQVHFLDSKRSHISKEELYFLAGNYPKFSKSVWSEIALHSMAKSIQKRNTPAAVFMGYSGDDVWGPKGKIDPETGDLLATPPLSGSNLSEIRLLIGFLTIPPAYMYIKDVAQIRKISNSREMDPWRLNNDYDRPIPRRIVEESGIPREWFGMKKHHITTTYFWPINRENRLAFYQSIKTSMNIGKWYVMAYYLQRRIFVSTLGLKIFFGKNIDFYDMMRKWATDVLIKKYSVLLGKSFQAIKLFKTDQ